MYMWNHYVCHLPRCLGSIRLFGLGTLLSPKIVRVPVSGETLSVLSMSRKVRGLINIYSSMFI